MAQQSFIQDGATLEFTTAGAVANNAVVPLTSAIGIALAPATAAAQVIPLAMEGVYELAKAPGVAFTLGQRLYWDTPNNRLFATNTGVPAGLCWRAAASGDATARVKLSAGTPT